MNKRLLVGCTLVVLLMAGVAGANTLKGRPTEDGPSLPDVTALPVCAMQKGFVVTQGIGCSNASGTSGGPNDVAEMLTLCTAAPVDVLTFSYIVWTPGIPGFVTGCDFALWNGGPSPGATACVGPAVPFATFGTYSIPVTGCKITAGMTAGGQFYAGMKQYGSGGMRWGYEDFAPSQDAWIRAPGCGASAWANLAGFGLPGDWVFRLVVDVQGPVEVENFSWGQIKADYR